MLGVGTHNYFGTSRSNLGSNLLFQAAIVLASFVKCNILVAVLTLVHAKSALL